MSRVNLEERLLYRCRGIDISDHQVEILRNLFGWTSNHFDFTGCQNYIRPQMYLSAGYCEATEESKKIQNERADEIGELIVCLIGKEFCSVLRENSFRFLKIDLGLMDSPMSWIIAQLKLPRDRPYINEVIKGFLEKSPQQMLEDIVRPTLCSLFGRKISLL